MHLVQILLPLYGGGKATPSHAFSQVATELTDRFGGVTSYMRAPAEGRWKPSGRSKPTRDELVVFEVMCSRLSPTFWRRYRKELERRFEQESIVIRAQRCVRL